MHEPRDMNNVMTCMMYLKVLGLISQFFIQMMSFYSNDASSFITWDQISVKSVKPFRNATRLRILQLPIRRMHIHTLADRWQLFVKKWNHNRLSRKSRLESLKITMK